MGGRVGVGLKEGASRKLQGTGNESTKEPGPITSPHTWRTFSTLEYYIASNFILSRHSSLRDYCHNNNNKRNMMAATAP